MESNWECFISGLCKLRINIILLFFFCKSIYLSYSVAEDSDEGEIIASIDDDPELLTKSFDLILMKDELDKIGKSFIGCPVHEKKSPWVTINLPRMVVIVISI